LQTSPDFKQVLNAYQEIYPDSAAANLVSWLERQDTRCLEEEDLTYGETPWRTWLKIIPLLQLKAGDRFVDLGCGTGILALYLAYQENIQVTGIDQIQRFIANARLLAEKFNLQAEFREGSVLELDLSEFNAVYCVCTCFSESCRQNLLQNLAKTQVGTRILSVTHGLDSPDLELVNTYSFSFAWGKDSVYVYRKH